MLKFLSVGLDQQYLWGLFEFLKSGPSAVLGAPRKNLGPPKVNFFIYCPILIKFEKQHFHMFTNDNWDIHLLIGAPLPPGPSPPPSSSLKKVKFFIYWVILMKFETQHIHMFTNNNCYGNLWRGASLPPGGPSPPPHKENIFFINWPIFMKFET